MIAALSVAAVALFVGQAALLEHIWRSRSFPALPPPPPAPRPPPLLPSVPFTALAAASPSAATLEAL